MAEAPSIHELIDQIEVDRNKPNAVDFEKAYEQVCAFIQQFDPRLGMRLSAEQHGVGESSQSVIVSLQGDDICSFEITKSFDPREIDPTNGIKNSFTQVEVESAIRVGLQKLRQKVNLRRFGMKESEI